MGNKPLFALLSFQDMVYYTADKQNETEPTIPLESAAIYGVT